jgi:integrase
MKDWTVKQCENAKPRKNKKGEWGWTPYCVSRSLYLLVSPDGRVRRFAFRFTKPSTHRVTATGLGTMGVDITLAEAHEKRDEFRRLVRKGGDPVEAKREAKIDARLTTEKGRTFESVASEFIAVQDRKYPNPGSTKNLKLLLLTHAKELCGMAIADIGLEHIKKALYPLWLTTPHQGRRAVAAVLRVFRYAKVVAGLNVANAADLRDAMKELFPPVAGPKKHHAAFDYARIPTFLRELHSAQTQGEALSPAVIEFIVLTAVRENEACGMQWGEINWQERVWTVSAARCTKAAGHRVPLCDRAWALLMRQRGPNAMGMEPDPAAYVWPSRDGAGHITGKAVYVYLTRTMGAKGKATIHGLRSSFRDWAGNETHVDRVTCELALSHRAGDAVELAYRRSDALAKRRQLMNAWAAFCEGQEKAAISKPEE